MKTDRRMLRGVIERVRAAVPNVTRERLADKLQEHFDAATIAVELDLAFGPPCGRKG
jgi:hypothetical protein